MSTVGTIEVIASINTSGYKSGAKKIDSINKGIENNTDSTTSNNNKSWLKQGSVMGAVAGVASSVFSKAMSVVSDSVGDAVKRVDTLNNFPKIMTNLGYSAGEAKTELGKLEKGVLGLPTSLDQIALSMQRLTPSSKSISYATDLALAMNNAILSGGSSMDSQRAATEQLTQAFSRGKFELEEFKSLQVAMPAQLAQVAKFLGITSGNTQELYAKLQDGTISMDTFKDAMITMSKEGGAGFASFETQAKDATGGIGTSMGNLKISIARGLGDIIKALGTDNINEVIKAIGDSFTVVKDVVIELKGPMKEAKDILVNTLGPSLQTLGRTLNDKLLPALERMKPVLVFLAIWFGGPILAGLWLVINALNVLSYVLGWIGQVVSNVFGWFKQKIDETFPHLVQLLQIAWGTARWVFGSISNIIGVVFGFISTKVQQVGLLFSMTFGAIKNTVSGAWQFIRSSFSSAVDFVGGLINRIGGFFSGVWNGVKGGVAAAMGAVKGAVSGTVNWIIDKINTVIRGYQKTAGKLPGAPSINEIPKLAKGGIVMPTPGGTIAQIAEAGEAEAVIPLSKLDAIISGGGGSGSGGSKITQYNTIYTELDMNVVNRKLTWELGRA